ncbi:VOC family protein [Sphingorhabdus sp. Alg239-R122]|uniref:VOC family protein n=1 Tax=Sphingorhabdus sp. Alg239-R122 TaxID=2305989 RepID=UPI0013DC22C2|nr:VOC family protein [Sphingorhabdus sp. Alg239-R122]
MTKCYITLGSSDLDRSRAYYDAVMPALGAKLADDYPGMTYSYAMPDGFMIWITRPQNGEPQACGNGHTVGLYTDSPEQVDAAHKAALENGGSDEGAPGPRPMYGPEFYGGYARDPDGNKMSFVTYVKVKE